MAALDHGFTTLPQTKLVNYCEFFYRAAGDPDARRQIAEFRVAAGDKLDELNATIVAFQLYGREAALDQSAGRATTDHIRQVAESFIEGQQLQLARRLGMLR